MPVLQDRVQETTTTGGTGAITLAGAVTGYRSFAQAFSIGDITYYTIDNGSGEWEIGVGTVGSGTLSRDSVLESSNSNALVNFSAGTKRVFCSAPTKVLLPDETGNSGKVLTTNGTDPAWTTTLNGMTIGNITPGSGAFTTLSASSTVSGTGFSTYLASPPAIGGTTPAAGAFTTLSSTGDTTLGDASADTLTINGTAVSIPNNLNFDSDTLFIDAANNRVGIGASSPQRRLHSAVNATNAAGRNAATGLLITNSDFSGTIGAPNRGVIQWAYDPNNPTAYIEAGTYGNGYLAFSSDGTNERLRIDSFGKVGIGTSSPGTLLSVLSGTANTAGDSITSAVATFTGVNYNFGTGGNPAALQVMSNSTLGADVGATIGLGGRYTGTQFAQFAIIKGAKENAVDGNFSTYLAFGTRANGGQITERMRISSLGNVSIGATTDAGYKAQVYAGTSVGANYQLLLTPESGALGRDSAILFGATFSNNWAGSDYAARFSGGIQYGASGGTTDPRSWSMRFLVGGGVYGDVPTERMRIDSSGNVGIGTSSPATKVHALTTSATAVGFRAGNSASYAEFQVDAAGNSQLIAPGGVQIFNTNGAERLRIDASGNLGLGVTPSAWSNGNAGFQTPYGWIVGNNQVNLFCNAYYNATTKYVQNGYASGIQMSTSGGIVFSLAGNNTSGAGANCVPTAAMTLDASGRLLVGTTSPTLGGQFNQVNIEQTNGGYYALGISNSAAGTMYLLSFGQGATNRGYVWWDNAAGVLKFTGQASGTYSDARLKEVKSESEYGLVDILKIQTKRFNWRRSGKSDVGVIAQDLYKIIPEAVEVGSDASIDPMEFSVDDIWKVREEKLVIPMIKAIQELHAEIESLKAKVN